MPTLQEIIEDDFGVGSEKTASANVGGFGGDADLEKVASELGLFGDSGEPVSNDDHVDFAGSEKIAAEGEFSGLYGELFPDDVDLGGVQKTAEEQKIASVQEHMGALAYDAFAHRFDQRIEKIASAVLSGDANVSASTATINGGNPHGDSRPGQTQPGNRPADAASAINTTPQVTNLLPPQSGAHVTGDEQSGKDATEKAASAAAFRKHLLLANLEQ